MMSNVDSLKVTKEQSGHVDYVCDKQHDDGGWRCMFCAGGLFECVHCGSFEGATTTHCPGRKMTAEEFDAVYAGDLDYRADEWVKAGSWHTPNRGWDLHAACVEADLMGEEKT